MGGSGNPSRSQHSYTSDISAASCRSFLFSLLFLLSLCSIAQAHSSFSLYDIPLNESMRDLKFFQTDIPVSCGDPGLVGRFFGQTGCMGVIDAMCMESVKTDVSALNDSFISYAEQKAFAKVIDRLATAERMHDEAMKRRETLLINLGESALDACNKSIIVEVLRPMAFFGLLDDCWALSSLYDYDASKVVSWERSALENSAKGMNDLIDVLKSASDELYWTGGGYENYSGDASRMYLRVRDFVRIANQRFNGTAEASGEFAKRWSAVFFTAQELHGFEERGLAQCSAARFLNATLGEKGILLPALALYREINNSVERLHSEHASLRTDVEDRLKATRAELKDMVDKGYADITAEEVTLFMLHKGTAKGKPSLVYAIIPAVAINSINQSLDGKGLEASAQQLLDAADSTYRSKQEFYVAKAIEKLNMARRKIDRVQWDINATKQAVLAMRDDARELAATARATAEATVLRYPASDIGIYLKGQARARIDEADAIINSVASKGAGHQFKGYLAATSKYNEATAYLTKEGAAKEKVLREAIALFDEFTRANQSAAADGIDTLSDSIPVSSAEELFKQENISDIEFIKSAIRNATESIYNKAELRYGYLSGRKAQVLDELKLLEIVDAPGARILRGELNSYESFVVGGRYDPREALGNYSRIERLFRRIENELAARKSGALEKYLGANAKVKKAFPSEVDVDGKANVTYYIEVINDLRLGSNGSLTVRIDGISAGPAASVTKPEGTYIRFDDGSIDILFSSVAAGPAAAYTFRITTESVIIGSTARSERILQFDKNELRRRVDVTMSSAEAVTARYSEPMNADECTAYVKGREVPAGLTSSGLTVTFRAEKGTNSLYAICKNYEPVAIIQHNQSVKAISERRTQIEYHVTIVSRIGDVEDFIAQVSVGGNASRDSIKVYDLSGALADGLTFMQHGADYLVRWKVPFLTRGGKEYRVVYEVDDPVRYLSSMKDSTAATAEAESIDVSSYLEKAGRSIALRRYDDALDELHEAQRKIDAEKNLRTEKSAAGRKLDDITARFGNLTYGSANYTALGWGEITIELDSKASEFSAKKSEIEDALAENRVSDAFRLLKDLEKISAATNVGSVISKKAKKVFDDLNAVKKDFFTLSKVANMSQQIADIEALETQFLTISSAIAEKDYLRAAALTNEFSEGVLKAEEARNNETAAAVKDLATLLDRIKDCDAAWKKARGRLAKSLEIAEDNPGPRFQQQKEDIEKMIEDIDAAIAEANAFRDALKDAAKKQDIERIILNVDAIRAQKEKLPELNASIGLADKAADGLRANAGAALEAMKAAISARAKGAPKEELTRLETLAGFVSKASQAFNDGNYLNSLAYIDYVRQQLERPEKKEGIIIDPMLIVAAAIAITATIAALALINMRKEKPEEPRTLRRAE